MSFLSENGDRADVPDICVLLTDGDPNVNSWRTSTEVKKLEDSGVHVLVVVVGTQVKVNGIIGSSTTAKVSVTKDFTSLGSIASNLTSLVCTTAGMHISEGFIERQGKVHVDSNMLSSISHMVHQKINVNEHICKCMLFFQEGI